MGRSGRDKEVVGVVHGRDPRNVDDKGMDRRRGCGWPHEDVPDVLRKDWTDVGVRGGHTKRDAESNEERPVHTTDK